LSVRGGDRGPFCNLAHTICVCLLSDVRSLRSLFAFVWLICGLLQKLLWKFLPVRFASSSRGTGGRSERQGSRGVPSRYRGGLWGGWGGRPILYWPLLAVLRLLCLLFVYLFHFHIFRSLLSHTRLDLNHHWSLQNLARKHMLII
jgi:hypothetical protein